MSLVTSLTGQKATEVVADPHYEFTELLGAGFRVQSPARAMAEIVRERFMRSEYNPDYDPFDDIKGYEDYASEFIYAEDVREVDGIKRRIDKEIEDREKLAASGGRGVVAEMLGGLADPMVLLPMGGAIRGASLLANVGRVALFGGATVAASEALLQSTQTQRSLQESGFSIAAGTLLIGLLGARAMKSAGKNAVDDMIRGIRRDMAVPAEGHVDPFMPNQARLTAGDIMEDTGYKAPDDAGHPAGTWDEVPADSRVAEGGGAGGDGGGGGTIRPDDLWDPESSVPTPYKDSTVAEEKLASSYGAAEALGWMSPGLRLATKSRSVAARRLSQVIAESPFVWEKNTLGVATPHAVERLIRNEDRWLGSAIDTVEAGYAKYRLGNRAEGLGPVRTRAEVAMVGIGDGVDKLKRATGQIVADKTVPGPRKAMGRAGKYMTYREFRRDVSLALRREEDLGIEVVDETARKIRAEYFERYGKRLEVAKLLDENGELVGGRSYLPRVYNRNKIIKNRPEFLAVLDKWLAERHPDFDAVGRLRVANEIADHILHVPDGRTVLGGIAPRHLKGRVIDLPDTFVGLEQFLEDDIEVILRHYHASVVPDLVFQERFGTVKMDDFFDKVRAEYHDKILNADVANPQKSGESLADWHKRLEKIRAKLDSHMRRDVKDLSDMVQILQNRYHGAADFPMVSRVSANAKRFNLIRQGGGFMVASIPDIARPGMVMGYGRAFRDGLQLFIKNRGIFKKLGDDAGLAGFAFEMSLNTRGANLADIGSHYGAYTMPERALDAATRHSFMLNLLSPWNHAWKTVSGVVASVRVMDGIEALAKGAKLSDAEKTWLAWAGIDKDVSVKIWEQFKAHGSYAGGHERYKMANTDAWDDPELASHYLATIGKIVDDTIVTPGVGDRPIMFNTALGSLAFQYKSFSVAATQHVLVSGLQRHDAATLNGVALSVFLGMNVYALKQSLAGREITDDPRRLVWEGIDRSGLIGIIADMNNTLEKATRGTVGISPLIGGGVTSRYAQRNIVGNLLGPSVGLVQDIARITGSVASGDANDADIRAVRRLLPYQNLFYMRKLFDAGEGIARSAFVD